MQGFVSHKFYKPVENVAHSRLPGLQSVVTREDRTVDYATNAFYILKF